MRIRNARVVSPGVDLAKADVVICEGRIAEIAAPSNAASDEAVFDADGLTVVPGFVDIHTHGRSGKDFCDLTDEAFDVMGRDRLRDGVTGFLATGLTRPESELAELCRCVERYKARSDGTRAVCLGVHLEGPFFNPEMAGAQNPNFLRLPDLSLVKRLHAISPIRKVSLAPELEGADAVIRGLVKLGIVVSGGHSAADYATFERARIAGMTHLTHFCNAMLPSHHLRPTMVTGGLLADDVFVEMICDGVHLSDPMIRLIAKAKGANRTILITDSMCAAGCPDGLYSLGGLRVRVADGCARLADVPNDPKSVVSNVAGSVALYPACFKRYVRVSGLPLAEAIKATSWNACSSLGIVDRGKIETGFVADFVFLNQDLDPVATMIGGKVVWAQDGILTNERNV